VVVPIVLKFIDLPGVHVFIGRQNLISNAAQGFKGVSEKFYEDVPQNDMEILSPMSVYDV
jgi:hypothetical protein